MSKPDPGMEENPPPPFEDTAATPAEAKVAKPRPTPLDMRAIHDEVAAKFPKTIARLAE
jgi:hypothetical protein